MISRIRGTLTQVKEHTALLENSGVYYEIMLPSALAERLKNNGKLGGEIEFKTIYYIEAGDKKSNHFPRLVGFIDEIDREFFSLFTQVPGMGVKKALKSLILPIKDIASAIETRDTSTLSRLPGVGGRLAEKIIAELNGKASKFALVREGEPLAIKEQRKGVEPLEKEALEILKQLQYRQSEAEAMISEALGSHPKLSRVEDLISLIFSNRHKQSV